MPCHLEALIPTIQSLPESRRPGTTACMHCPNALWYALPKGVRCFCRVMHAESFTSERPGERVEMCDGLVGGGVP